MTTTQEMPTPSTIPGEFWDIWLSSANSMTWTQDQMAVLATTWIEQARTMRHDGQKVLEVMLTQAKTQCAEATRLAEAGVKSATQSVPGWDLLTLNDMRRQIADLSAKVDTLAAR